jgi:hypothetical protein
VREPERATESKRARGERQEREAQGKGGGGGGERKGEKGSVREGEIEPETERKRGELDGGRVRE